MSKVGIYRIGFKEQNEVDDQWVMQEAQEERSLPSFSLDGIHWFKSIDQRNSNLTEDETMDETGRKYAALLDFVVRKDEDIALARQYDGRPLVVYVYAVDGQVYKLGTKSYPAYLVISDRYQGLDTREMAMIVTYESRVKLLK